MWEELNKLLQSNTAPWFIAIITAAITGWLAMRRLRYEKRLENEKLREEKRFENEKLRYEKRLEKFKETNESLFKERKQEVLAAIATLSIFKKDPEFEKNTIDVLLSRLYTELDYDIINSILTTLIQDSDREELLYIADGLQDFNRNFFAKAFPMNQRVNDISSAIKMMNNSIRLYDTDEAAYTAQVNDGKAEEESFLINREAVVKKYNEDFGELFAYQKYRQVWHKQISADAYATFMRKAYLANKKSELVLNLFQNDFNFVYMAEVKATTSFIERSAFGNAVFVKVDFDHIDSYSNSFNGSQINESSFRNGRMVKTNFPSVKFDDAVFSNLTFTDSVFDESKLLNTVFEKIKMKNIHFSKVKFNNVRFEGIEFENCTFHIADFSKTVFLNCTGLQQKDFENALRLDNECIFPDGILLEHNDDYIKRTSQSAEPETRQVTNVQS